MSRTYNIFIFRLLLIFVIYFITAKFGLSLHAVSRFATLVWIPTGFSLAMILLYGNKYWPAIALGAFAVNLLTGAPVFVAIGIAIGNTLEALVGTFLLKKIFNFINSISRLKDVLALVLITPFSAAISATIGVTSLLFGGVIPLSQYFITWIPWWVGDAISILIVAPLILLWSIEISFNRNLSRTAEFISLIIVVIAVGIFIFNGNFFRFPINNPSIIYLVYPPIIWAAIRFGQREVAAILFIFSAFAIWDTMLGFGPFASTKISMSLLYLQFFMIITSLTSLILAVVVSERRRLEERKDDFISMASHELRTPVTSIKLYSQIVKTKLDEKKPLAAKRFMLKLDDQLHKLTALVIDLLDVSRMQSGKIQMQETVFNLNQLIKETVESLQRTTENHTLIIKGKFVHNITGDRERIYQVLVNLIINAIKYSPEGGKVFIHCKNMDKYVQISVEDSGIGIDKNHLQRIFEKLYRAPSRQKDTSVPGLGIGLYVSSEIVKMHKGKIWAQSNKNKKGATFYFTLPKVSNI